MSDENSIILGPREHGKVGIYHCGVTREGRIAVGGHPRFIDEGEDILFEQSGITANRKGEVYTFSR